MTVARGSRELRGRFALAGVLLLVVCILAAAPGYASEKLKVGDTPPPLGKLVNLSDYRGGKIVVISFWAESALPALIDEINSLWNRPTPSPQAPQSSASQPASPSN